MRKLKFEKLRNLTHTPQPEREVKLKFEPSSVNSRAGTCSRFRAELALPLGYNVKSFNMCGSSPGIPHVVVGRAAVDGKTPCIEIINSTKHMVGA